MTGRGWASNMTSGRSYVFYGSVPLGGHWQSDQNLAHALAARHPVLYVSPQLSPVSPFRYGLDNINRHQVADILERRVRVSGRLRTFTPLALPPLTNKRIRHASLPLVRAQIRYAVQKSGIRRPIVVSAAPLGGLSGAAGETLRVGLIMDHLEAGAAFIHRDPVDIAQEVAATCAAADLLCVPSRPLQDLLASRGWETKLLPWGFARDLADEYDNATEPSEYEGLPRPLLGYAGSIDDRLDYRLIVGLADHFDHGSIVFVGPMSPRLSSSAREALGSRRNIHLLGVRPRRSLPAYLKYLDCALLPYVDMEFTRYQSPLKVWDYLYAGPPLVATGSAELRRYKPPLLYFSDSVGTVPDQVSAAIAGGPAGAAERRRFALANTWETRGQQLDDLIDEAVCGSPVTLRAA